MAPCNFDFSEFDSECALLEPCTSRSDFCSFEDSSLSVDDGSYDEVSDPDYYNCVHERSLKNSSRVSYREVISALRQVQPEDVKPDLRLGIFFFKLARLHGINARIILSEKMDLSTFLSITQNKLPYSKDESDQVNSTTSKKTQKKKKKNYIGKKIRQAAVSQAQCFFS